MPGIYTGRIANFSVSEKSPRGQIFFVIDSAGPFNGQGPDFPRPPNFSHTFKLDEDSDQSFAGMASICARMVQVIGAPPPPVGGVIIEVHTGGADEIDVLRVV
jgi:hypothetical protein